MSKLAYDGRRRQHVFVQGWQDVIAIDLNEVVERGGIGDDDDHGRRRRPLSSSCLSVSRSCSKSSMSYA